MHVFLHFMCKELTFIIIRHLIIEILSSPTCFDTIIRSELYRAVQQSLLTLVQIPPQSSVVIPDVNKR